MKGTNWDYNGALTSEEAYLNVSSLQGLAFISFHCKNQQMRELPRVARGEIQYPQFSVVVFL